MRDQKEKRTPTTKRVFVSAKYFLTSLALDREIVYPVELNILSDGGGSCMSLKDRDAVLNIIASPFVLESGVIKFILKPNRTCLDLKRQGMMEIPRETLPYVRHNTTLVAGQATELYDIIHFLRREMLNFTAFPVFFVSNLLLVQRKKYYFNRATVSRNCSIVL